MTMQLVNETTVIGSKSVRVVIYDNLRLVGAGLESILKKNQHLEVIGKYQSFPPMISLLRAQPDVDLLLLSLTSLNNEELGWIETICQSSSIPILVLCQTIDLIGVKQAFGYGIKGCVAMDDDSFEIDCAIQSISQGQQFLSSAIGLSTMSFWPDPNQRQPDIALSSREREILNLIALGMTNQEIADKIFTSKRTVEGHRQNLINKTQSNNTAELIVKAMKMRLID